MSVQTPPPHRCSSCKSSSVDPRNLLVFIDGTSNKPGDKDTNVMKLYRQSRLGSATGSSQPEQRSSYFAGIGVSENAALESYIEMAFAWNVKKNVKDAYAWLVEEYRLGDQIYLFGFSRGAYQVRSLASMIHEVGLVTEKHHIDTAYFHFCSIDSYNDETRKSAINFKRDFCRHGVRVHFVGVWDTVSSLGFVKKKVHITSSASVTNACYFRHALALDERRVKFIPEYFTEMNAYRSTRSSQFDPENNVKEVWFAGSHSDVGGTSRAKRPWSIYSKGNDPGFYPFHAGNVSLLWMRREATACGLAVKKEEFMWDPEDVDLGRRDTMMLPWSILEIWPIYHQISFSGTGKHRRRLHLAQPRVVIPRQLIHSSVLFSDMYIPLAVLGDGINIPTIPRISLSPLWTSELQDEHMTREMLQTLMDGDEQKTLGFLEKIVFLLHYGLTGIQAYMPIPPWAEKIGEQNGWNIFALAVICFKISPSSVSPEIVKKARDSLSSILGSENELYPRGVFCVLRFSTRDPELRHHFIAHENVIKALMVSLERTAANSNDSSFRLVIDSLYELIHGDSDNTRDAVVKELLKRGDNTKRSRLAVALGVKEPTHLMASLSMVICLAQKQSRISDNSVERRVVSLARKCEPLVGPVAVRALMALRPSCELEPYCHLASLFTRKEGVYIVPFDNILGLLGHILPRLDAEEDSAPLTDTECDTSPANGVGITATPSSHGVPMGGGYTLYTDNADAIPELFRVLKLGNSGRYNVVMQELVSRMKSYLACKRTVATLTLLKLFACDLKLWDRELWRFAKGEVIGTFVSQLRRKETSLLAAYALYTCARQKHITINEIPPDAIKNMLTKDWFDGAIGRVEGITILEKLMTLANGSLKPKILSSNNLGDVVDILVDRLAVRKWHEVRMSLRCLDALGQEIRPKLISKVKRAVNDLTDDIEWEKSVKILSGLARMPDSENIIEQVQLIRIVDMLRPSSGLLRHQLAGPAAALYALSKNDTLRKRMKASSEFSALRRDHGRVHSGTA